MKFKNKKIIILLILIIIFLSGCGNKRKVEENTKGEDVKKENVKEGARLEEEIKTVYPVMNFSESKCKKDVDPNDFKKEKITTEWFKGALVVKVRVSTDSCSRKMGGFNFTEEKDQITVYLFEGKDKCSSDWVYDLKYTIEGLERKDYSVIFEKKDEPL